MCLRPSTGKGKRKASPSPSPSSVEKESIPDQSHPVIKKLCLSSPAWVKQAALAKMVSKSKSSSSSKGLAGFTAMVNNASLSATHMETNHGLRSGSSSSRSRSGGVSAKAKAGNTAGTRWCFPWRNLFLDRFCDFQTVFLTETQKFYPAF